MWLPSGLLREFWKNSVGKDANLVLVDLGRPLSRGTIQLESSDPFTHPLIDPKYFDRPEDLQAMVDGKKADFLLKLFLLNVL
jgi:choline dehydrogenase-like flavoprotein